MATRDSVVSVKPPPTVDGTFGRRTLHLIQRVRNASAVLPATRFYPTKVPRLWSGGTFLWLSVTRPIGAGLRHAQKPQGGDCKSRQWPQRHARTSRPPFDPIVLGQSQVVAQHLHPTRGRQRRPCAISPPVAQVAILVCTVGTPG